MNFKKKFHRLKKRKLKISEDKISCRNIKQIWRLLKEIKNRQKKKQKREAEALEDKCKVKQNLIDKLQVQINQLTAAIDNRDKKIQEHKLSAEKEKKETENKHEREAESLKKVMEDQMKEKDELIAKLQAQAAIDQKKMTDALNEAKKQTNHIENMEINWQIHEEELMLKTANLKAMEDKLEMKDKDISKLQNEFETCKKENESSKRKNEEKKELSLGSPYKKIKIQHKSGMFYFTLKEELKRLIIDTEPQTGKENETMTRLVYHLSIIFKELINKETGRKKAQEHIGKYISLVQLQCQKDHICLHSYFKKPDVLKEIVIAIEEYFKILSPMQICF